MIDVTPREPTHRRALARCRVSMLPETTTLVANNAITKGDVLAAARIAGIGAAKRTAELIPMCHPVLVGTIAVNFSIGDDFVEVEAQVETVDRTGVEMEAMMACTTAALTVYDMCKSSDRTMTIDHVALWEKSGAVRAPGAGPRPDPRTAHWRCGRTVCKFAGAVNGRVGRSHRYRQGDNRHGQFRHRPDGRPQRGRRPLVLGRSGGGRSPTPTGPAWPSRPTWPGVCGSRSSSSSPRAAPTSLDGVAALHGWGNGGRGHCRHAAASSRCSMAATGPVVSGPALLLGLADLVVMSAEAVAFVSGPQMVAEFTGVEVGLHELGGVATHARSSGCAPWRPTMSRAPWLACSSTCPRTPTSSPRRGRRPIPEGAPRLSCAT